MRISLSKKFVALANPRCASTSIRRMVNRFSDFRSGVNCDLKHHSALRTVERFLIDEGHNPDEFYFFTTVRNPWDRVVSIYHYGLKNPKSTWHKPAVASKDFKVFVHSEALIRHFRPKSSSRPLREGPHVIDTFMRDNKGVVRGHVFRLEELDTIADVLKKEVGIDVNLPHVNATSHNDYRSYYDEVSKNHVAYLFERDIKRFGYVF